MTEEIETTIEALEAMAEVSELVGKIGKLFNDGEHDYNVIFLTLATMLLLHIQSHADDDDTAIMSVAFVTEQLTKIVVDINEKREATLQ